MPRGLVVVLGLCSILELSAQTRKARTLPQPSEFYIVSESFSDYGPAWYYRLLSVKQDGADALIRYVRIAPYDVMCQRTKTVQAAEIRIRNTSPAELAGSNNPCAVGSAELRRALRKFGQTGGGFEFIQFGVVAKCGSGENVLHLPPVDYDKLKSTVPARIARLWDLVTDVTTRAFGKVEIFQDITPEQDWDLQLTGKTLVPELISGRYDRGWAKWNGGFPKLLADYAGPTKKTFPVFVPQLENASAFQFSRYIDPVYPRIAMLARVQGEVELRLGVLAETGEIEKVEAISGPAMLRTNAVETAKKWKLVPGTVSGEAVSAVIDYSLKCP